MTITFSSSLNCIFNFQLYPFDTQTCSVLIHIENSPPGYLDLVVKETPIPAIFHSIPLDYYLSSTRISVHKATGTIDYKFQLSRYMVFPFLSVYVPTFMMLLIAYGTLWIPADDFQDRGTMSLTTLLVLISLYTQALNTLPVTPYVKMVDYWYLFCVLFISTIIFMHLASSNMSRVQSSGKPNRRFSIPSNEKILKSCKIVYGAMLMLFQISYWMFLCATVFMSNRL